MAELQLEQVPQYSSISYYLHFYKCTQILYRKDKSSYSVFQNFCIKLKQEVSFWFITYDKILTFWCCSPPSLPFLGLLSEQLVEEQPLDDDGLAGEESRGRDGGGRGSSSQDKTTSGSECHTDGVNDGSGSSRDGEEAACQSEDDKALEVKMIISYVLIHLQIW